MGNCLDVYSAVDPRQIVMSAMRYISQTKLHGNGVKGNCMAAVLATVFGLSIGDVPAFEDMPGPSWIDAFYSFVDAQGYEFENSELDPYESFSWARLYIASGPSPRGEFWHSVVCDHGEMVHDPHPSGDGLREVKVYWWFPKKRAA